MSDEYEQSNRPHVVNWPRWPGTAMIVIASMGVVAFLSRFIVAEEGRAPGPFETLSTAAGFVLVIRYGYLARTGGPRPARPGHVPSLPLLPHRRTSTRVPPRSDLAVQGARAVEQLLQFFAARHPLGLLPIIEQ